MNILVIQTSHSGIYYHRQFVPHYYWHESGDEFKHDLTVTVETQHFDKLMHIINNVHFDIVLFSISIVVPPQMPNFIEFMKRRGSKIVLDIDDRYMRRNDVRRSIKKADSIICVSQFLAEHYFQYGAKRMPYVIENGIYSGGVPSDANPDAETWGQYRQFINNPVDNEDVVFGYLGSTRHEEDLKVMQYDFRANRLFVVCEEYYKVLNVDYYSTLKHWNEYAWEYDPIDVALAPLVENKFNFSKSSLKIFEAGFKKKAIICSDTGPYKRVRDEFKSVVDFVPVGDSWEGLVRSYTLDEARQRGEELYKLVQPYEIRTLNRKRRHIYEQIIGDATFTPIKLPPEPKKKRGSNYTKPKKRKKRK